MLYIGLYSAGRILVIDTDGKLVRKIEVPVHRHAEPHVHRRRQDDVRHGSRRQERRALQG